MSGTFPLVFSVTSGKGGVGKTNISVNLAICLAQLGKQVVLIDADLGLANVDVVLGLTPQKNIFHLFHEGATIADILFPTPYGFSILPASSGVSEMLTLSTGQKLELLEVDEEDTSALRLKFPPSPRSGNYPVIMEGVGKSYGDHVVFKNANLTIERGDKVAFVGKNGEGKSTLVKCIMKEIEHEGTLTIGHNVQIGYFAQNQASLLDENLTVFQTIDDVAKGEIRNKIRDLLGAFMFGGPEESMKKVKVLSGGERMRLAMIKLLLEPVNLLILDEPTNHLDMKTKDILKQALLDFDGTLILVSHDRDFLDGLVSKVYEFGNKQVKEHLSGIYEFLEKKKMDSLRELER